MGVIEEETRTGVLLQHNHRIRDLTDIHDRAVSDKRKELGHGDGEAGDGFRGSVLFCDSGNGKGKWVFIVWSIRSSDNKLWVVCRMLAGEKGWETL